MAQTVKYISVAGAGSKDGSSAANAWDNTQWATALAAMDGNTRLLIAAGTYNQTGELNFGAGTPGSSTTRNTYVAVNASTWVDDGSLAIFDGGSGAYSGIQVTTTYNEFRNIRVTNYGVIGLYGSGGLYNYFYNCEFTNCAVGADLRSVQKSTAEWCKFNNNTGDGQYRSFEYVLIGCEAIGNGGDGFQGSVTCTYLSCISADNSGYGYYFLQSEGNLFHSIADNNTLGGVYLDATFSYAVFFNKLTNNGGYGIKMDSTVFAPNTDWNSFYSNTSGEVDYGGSFSEGLGQNNITLTEDYYTDASSNNYTSSVDDPSVGYAYKIGNNATNTGYISNQFPPIYPTSIAPTFAGITQLEAAGRGTLKASWSAGSGTITGYAVYIREGSSDLFSSTYKVLEASSSATAAKMIEDAAGAFLVGTGNYYVGVRACNNASEDSNTVTLNISPTGDGLSTLNEDPYREVLNYNKG